jgi:tetratricopeptide (TPR) repeat protein
MYAERGIKLDESITVIQRALAIEPTNGYFLDSLGWAYFQKGLYAKALAELNKAIEEVPDDPVIQEHLGDIYFRLSRIHEAEAAWEKSLELKADPAVERKLQQIRHLIEEAAHGTPEPQRH